MKKARYMRLFIVSSIIILLGLVSFYIYKWREPVNTANAALNNIRNEYEVLSDILYSGFIDMSSSHHDEYGVEYFEITEEGYNTLENLRNHMSEVYTDSLAEDILNRRLKGDAPTFKEINGKLCRMDAYEDTTSISLPIKSAKRTGKNQMEVTMYADSGEYCTVLQLKLESEKWKIDKIGSISLNDQ